MLLRRGDGLACVVVMNFHIQIQQLIQIERLRARDRHAERVANKVAHVVVFQELRMLGKNGALGGLLHIGLKPHQPFLARLVEELVHHLQGIDVSLFGEFGSAKHSRYAGRDFLENVERIGDQHRAHRRSSDDEEFGRLKQDFYISVLHQVAAHDRGDDDQNADD